MTESTRRRVIKGALAVAPVILALKGQSALATTGCASPSRIMSGNLSPGHTPPPCGTGFSPGYWKVCQHLDSWRGLTRPTFPNGTCTNGMPSQNATTPGSPFSAIFTDGGALASYACWHILAYPARIDQQLAAFDINQLQLARHLIASYLNLMSVPNFPLTLTQIREMWTEGKVGNYCPSGITCTLPWNAQTIVCYLRNYTMDQGSVSTDPITWSCAGL